MWQAHHAVSRFRRIAGPLRKYLRQNQQIPILGQLEWLGLVHIHLLRPNLFNGTDAIASG